MEDRYPDIVEAAFNDGKNLLGVYKLGVAIAESNPIFEDIPWIEANGRHGHEMAVRTGKRSMHKVAYGMGRSAPANFVSKLFYGDPVQFPADPCGFSSYYDIADPAKAQNAVNVIDAGCDGGSSVWLVHWHPTLLMVGYPNGSEAGLSDDRIDSALCISDWRLAARVANIGLESADRVGVLMAEASFRVPSARVPGRMAYYMPKRVHEWFGKPVKFRDIVVRMIPELRDDEPRVV